MIAFDTNVIVRYIMQDDPGQAAIATQLIESLSDDQPGFITLVSVLELVWVLGSCYELTRVEIARALEVLLSSKQLVLDRSAEIVRALRIYAAGTPDFADCLIERIANSVGCERVCTFDKAAAKKAGMTLL